MITNVRLKIDVDSGNAALVDHPAAELVIALETVKRLVVAAAGAPAGYHLIVLRDTNGNRIGEATLAIEGDDE